MTDEERAAIAWIGSIRRGRENDRTTINDILVDALWDLVQKEGRTRDDFLIMSPPPRQNESIQSNVTEMPKLTRGTLESQVQVGSAEKQKGHQ